LRVTIDIDRPNPYKLLWKIIRGSIMLRKLPSSVRVTQKGYHILWRGLDYTEAQAFMYRERIGDDMNRISLDAQFSNKPKQILFSKGSKVVTVNGSMPGAWYKILKRRSVSKNFDLCPFCYNKIDKSILFWGTKRQFIEVWHGNDVCHFKLKTGKSLLLRRLFFLNR